MKRLTGFFALAAFGGAALTAVALVARPPDGRAPLGAFAAFLKEIKQQLGWLNQRLPNERVYVSTDKTLYTPGEAIWLTAFVRDGDALTPLATSPAVTVELLDPKGATSASIRLAPDKHGLAKGDFQLTDAMPGGRYTLRAFTDAQLAHKTDSGVALFEKVLTVQAVTLPRVKLTLDFARKAYGPGDEVTATVKAFSNDNEPLSGRALRGLVRLNNEPLPEVTTTVGPDGTATLRFRLPQKLDSPDGLLTVTVPHEGLTESVARAVPIVLNRIKLQLLPEGGDLVAGLPGRVAVRATNEFGEPADVAGDVLDGRGRKLTTFRTLHDGLGLFELTPAAGQTYQVKLTQPEAAAATPFAVPDALPGGYALRVERPLKTDAEVAIQVQATVAETGLLVAVQGGRVVWEQGVKLGRRAAQVAMPTKGLRAGVVQVTLFDAKKVARAERLVFVNQQKQLRLTIKPDKERYATREKIRLTVQAVDERGLPAQGAVALSVVDDQNLAFADDKQHHLLTWMLAEADLREPLKEPHYYFDPAEKDAPAALDLVLLTHGWRRFRWEQVRRETAPPPPMVLYDMRPMMAAPAGAGMPRRNRAGAVADQKMARNEVLEDGAAPPALEAEADGAQFGAMPPMPIAEPAPAADAALMNANADVQQAPAAKRAPGIWPRPPFPQPVEPGQLYRAREFAAPVYDKPTSADAPRTDFRSTLFWAPVVVLGKTGRAEISFYNADGVTSYRATAEGLADDGTAGRAEVQFFTQPPLSISLKLPPHVVLGDTVGLPLVLANHTENALTGPLRVVVPAGWRPTGVALPTSLTLAPRGTQTLLATYVVGGETGSTTLEATFNSATGLRDGLKQTLPVLPRGYPVARAFSGNQAAGTYLLEAKEALPGTLHVALTAFPSVESDLLKGIAAILQEPSGCFEQTSTTSYPNVLVLDYLHQQRDADPALVAKAEGLLDRGYAKLTSYETKEKGYEWFGGAPAHEALTAYGLLQFADMQRVRPSTVSQAMVDRTHNWLMGRRDGKGGFQKSAQALDQFGRADDDITNAYIVYSLAEAGYRDIGPELTAATAKAAASGDPYQLALVANALQAFGDEGRARPLLAALYTKQGADGAWEGLKHSVTRSTGISLRVETTALALLATLRDERRPGQALASGVRWLVGARSGAGNFGSTQGTILALKALTSYAKFAQQTAEDGAVLVLVDDREVGRVAYKAGQKTEISLPGLEKFCAPREDGQPHKLTVRFAAGVQHPLPYTLAADWRTLQPPTSDKCAVRLTTALAGSVARVGESLRLTATLTNTDANAGQPMTMALLGLPAGLTPQPWQLKQLQERGTVAFYELKDGRLACYFRDLKPGEVKVISLDLKAEVPGRFAAPASAAYLYYTDELKWWVPGTAVRVRG